VTTIRIIGIGSYQGADQAGWLLTDALQAQAASLGMPAGQLDFCRCLFPAQLWQLVEGVDLAVLIDAVPGKPDSVAEIVRRQLSILPGLHSSHGIGVGEALDLVGSLLVAPPRMVLLGVGVKPMDKFASTDIRRVLPVLQARVGDVIGQYLAGLTPTCA